MDRMFCPGARFLRQPKPQMYSCPTCGAEVEIWSDEIRGYCSNCKRTVLKDADSSCLDWCEYGKGCVGEEMFNRYMENRAVTLKKRLLQDLEAYFGEDTRRIQHAMDVLEFAMGLIKDEMADWHIVVPASILHDVGVKPAEQKYGFSEAHYQEVEGPPVARKILLKHGLRREDIEEICDIIGHHHNPRENETANFRVVYDADCLVNMRATAKVKSRQELQRFIEGTFLTRAAKVMAKRLYL
jgi:HD superfamily phosphohydrolase YqeK